MKYYFVLLFFFHLSHFIFGQDVKIFDNEIELDSISKVACLSKIFPLDNFCVFAEDEQEDTMKSFIEIHGDKFLFFEIAPSDTMVVFDGKLCGGYETGVVNVYKIENGQPTTLLSNPGKIADIEAEIVWIYTYPCCAAIVNVVKPYSLRTGKSVGGAHVFYDRHDAKTIVNSIEKDHQQVELINDCEIRWSPFWNDGPLTPFCENLDNVVGNFPKGREGKAVKVGWNDWILLQFDSVSIDEGVCLNDYRKKLIGIEDYFVYGWMKTKNIRYK